MPKTRDHLRGEVRSVTEDGTIELLAVVWGVVDDYGTRFIKGAFSESLEARLPTIAWGHQWTEPVGRTVSYRETDEGLFITARLDIGQGIARALLAARAEWLIKRFDSGRILVSTTRTRRFREFGFTEVRETPPG